MTLARALLAAAISPAPLRACPQLDGATYYAVQDGPGLANILAGELDKGGKWRFEAATTGQGCFGQNLS